MAAFQPETATSPGALGSLSTVSLVRSRFSSILRNLCRRGLEVEQMQPRCITPNTCRRLPPSAQASTATLSSFSRSSTALARTSSFYHTMQHRAHVGGCASLLPFQARVPLCLMSGRPLPRSRPHGALDLEPGGDCCRAARGLERAAVAVRGWSEICQTVACPRGGRGSRARWRRSQ